MLLILLEVKQYSFEAKFFIAITHSYATQTFFLILMQRLKSTTKFVSNFVIDFLTIIINIKLMSVYTQTMYLSFNIKDKLIFNVCY